MVTLQQFMALGLPVIKLDRSPPDLLNAWTRAKMREEGVFRRLFPPTFSTIGP